MSFKMPSFNELNNTQKVIINLLPKSNKLAVIGGPGTGKTIIALQAAAIMANSGKKCLILSYSKTLKSYIANVAKEYKMDISNITINTYHSWFWSLLKNDFKIENPAELQETPFVYDLKKLMPLIDQFDFSNYDKYDYMFIDEAQDVQDGLIKIFAKFCKKILVTFDDSQKIGNESGDSVLSYDHSNILTDLMIGDQFFDLIDNYRNTAQVETAARLLFNSYDTNEVTLNKVTANRVGKKPRLLISKDDSYEKIAKFIVEHYDASKSIGIFYSQEAEDHGLKIFNSVKAAIQSELKKANINARLLYKFGKTNIDDSNATSNNIFLVSLKTSKGLEFDDVYVLTEDISIDNYQKKNLLYVSFTRSKSMTNIILQTNTNQEIKNILVNNKYLFEQAVL